MRACSSKSLGRWGLLGASASVLFLAAWTPQPAHQSRNPIQVIISGGSAGYLAPCGCTKPMTGGIKRLATLVSQRDPEKTLFLEAGPLTGGRGRQDELKLEAASAILEQSKVDAILWSGQDARLGPGSLLSALRLAPGKWVNSALNSAEYGTNPWISRKGFIVFGVTADTSSTHFLGRSAPALNLEGMIQGRSIALTDLSLEGATALAKKHADLGLIVYRVTGAAAEPVRVGSTLLLAPGSNGRSVWQAEFDGAQFQPRQIVSLEASVKDDPGAARIYDLYLGRVGRERLLDKVVRTSDSDYAGSKNCINCHKAAGEVHFKSKHAVAFSTLVKEKHDKDPDCVSCHVTGLESSKGFRSITTTPQFAQVGCESCHGPSRPHARAPKVIKTPKDAKASCISCHTSDTSPGFDYLTFWARISHR